MWNKRREDDVPARPVMPAAPALPDARVEPQPAAPAKPAVGEPPRGVAAIGKSVVIKGQILSREDLYLDGEIEGTVEVPEHRLTIGPHAKLKAGIRAREVLVLGSVNGDVDASDKIDLRKDANLIGNIKAGGIIIEDGAYFKGSIDIVRSEPAKPLTTKTYTPAPTPPAPVPASAAIAGDQKR